MKFSLIPFTIAILSKVPKTSSAFQPVALTGVISSTTGISAVTSDAATTTSRLFSSSKDMTLNLNDVQIQGPEIPPIPATSKRLFLVRHGEVINPGGDRPVYYGAMDVSLSPLGEQEAKIAAEYLKQFDLQHVSASPLSRAKFGANEVLSRQGSSDTNNDDNSEIKIYKGFTELDRGSWCGKTKDEIGSEMMEKFDACDESVTPEGGESYPALKKRVLEARDELLDVTSCGQASAIVSHLQVTRCMLSDALDIPTEEMYNFKIATASVACVDFDTVTGKQVVHFQNFKPDVGLSKSKDGAN
jgi:broad specificity phosphatase PhoE